MNRLPFLLVLLASLGQLACSGEDEGPGGRGTGVATGGRAGASGTSSLAVGGRGGSGGVAGGGASGAAGATGLAGAAGSAGWGGSAGIAAVGGAGGIAGAGGAGLGGAGGVAGTGGAAGSGGLAPSSAVCGNGVLEAGERCDGTAGSVGPSTCAQLLGDPQATGAVVCRDCFPGIDACISCRDGKQNGLETDLDCGGGGCSACPLGLACTVDSDCASKACVANFCNRIDLQVGVSAGVAPAGGRARVPIIVSPAVPLPKGVTAKLTTTGSVTLEPSTTSDPSRLVALVPPDAAASQPVLLTIGGHTFPPLTLPVPKLVNEGALRVETITGTRGTCAAKGIPLVKDIRNATPSSALEIPLGVPICLHLQLATPQNFSPTFGLAGQSKLVGFPTGNGFDADFTIPMTTPVFDAAPAVAPIALTMTYGGFTSVSNVPLVLAARTIQKQQKGAGTPSSPDDFDWDFADLGAPFASRAVVQVFGGVELPKGGATLPDNVVLRGSYPGDSVVAVADTPLALRVGAGGGLWGLEILGAPTIDGKSSSVCVATSAAAVQLRDLEIRRCTVGLRLETGAEVTFAYGDKTQQVETSSIHAVTFGIIGDAGAKLTGVKLSFIDNAKASVFGFPNGRATLIRPFVSGVDVPFDVGVSGTYEIIGARAEKVGVLLPPTLVGAVLFTGGNFSGAGQAGGAVGIRPGAGAAVTARGVRLSSFLGGAVVAEGASVELTASEIIGSGSMGKPALAIGANGMVSAYGVRITGSLGDALSGTAATAQILLTGSVIEGAAERGVTLLGGPAVLRTVRIRDAVGDGLAVLHDDAAPEAVPLSLDDVDIVSHQPRTSAPLVSYDRRVSPTVDHLRFSALVAGAGATVSSKEGALVCVDERDDPAGGRYVTTNKAKGIAFCY